jgi:hypothetical protein
VTRPISLALLLATLGLVLLIVVPPFRQTRDVARKKDRWSALPETRRFDR